jgi:hypothetical protein
MNFWTGGTQKGCQGQWGWCGVGGAISDDIKWEKGQPDNKGGQEDCVHMRFVLNATGTIITDRNCTNKFIFACEVINFNFETKRLMIFINLEMSP